MKQLKRAGAAGVSVAIGRVRAFARKPLPLALAAALAVAGSAAIAADVALARVNAIPATFVQALTYGAPSGTSAANGTEDAVSMLSPNVALTAANLAVRVTVVVNNNSARSFTLRVNGTDTLLTCTVPSLQFSCTSNAAVAVPALSLLSIKSDRPAVFNADPTEARIAFQLTQ